MSSKIKQAAVIGAGQMGAGIAQVLAASGIKTLLHDTSKQALEKGHATIEKFLSKALEKEKISSEQKSNTLANVSLVEDIADLRDADLVVEAIIENFEIKKKLFSSLDTICKPEALFASNTSSISITKLAACTNRSEQFIGMHFMNPVPIMKLVEIIRGLQTSDSTYKTIIEVTEQIKKTPVMQRRIILDLL